MSRKLVRSCCGAPWRGPLPPRADDPVYGGALHTELDATGQPDCGCPRPSTPDLDTQETR